MKSSSRRRFITIMVGAFPASYMAMNIGVAHANHRAEKLIRHKMIALGADAQIILPETHLHLLDVIHREVQRLEKIFSLYRDDSHITLLNRQGYLDDPSIEMVELLGFARHVSKLSGGAFDMTVQPLWKLYADHGKNGALPPMDKLDAALKKIGWQHVHVAPHHVEFTQAGMQITLNGIAQGYITDRIAGLLRGQGLRGVLIDMGEIYALGPHPMGRAWQIANKEDDGHIALGSDCALATSQPPLPLEGGNLSCLISPHSGKIESPLQSVRIMASSAMLADGISTALAVMPPKRHQDLLQRSGVEMAWMTSHRGEIEIWRKDDIY